MTIDELVDEIEGVKRMVELVEDLDSSIASDIIEALDDASSIAADVANESLDNIDEEDDED